MNQQISIESRNKNRRKLIILFLMFFGSVAIAWILVNNSDHWRPWGTKNNGDLVVPVRSISDIRLQTLNGEAFSIKQMLGKWIIVYIGQEHCDKNCATNLYNIRQARLGQKGEHGRIERLYIMLGSRPQAPLRNVMTEHKGMQLVSVNDENKQVLLKRFAIQHSAVADTAQRVYLIDPLGNLMMKYDQGFDPRGLAKDLELLLKVSLLG